jgi:hypothetical protein
MQAKYKHFSHPKTLKIPLATTIQAKIIIEEIHEAFDLTLNPDGKATLF